MKKLLLILLLTLLLGACSLAEDVTPPPAVGTAAALATLPAIDAAQPTLAPTVAPTAARTADPTADPEAAEAPSDEAGQLGVIEGQLVNATEGGVVPAGLLVELYAQDDGVEVLFLETVADDQGRFRFEALELVTGRLYAVAAEYQGVLYFTDPLHLAETAPQVELALTVYETSEDASLAMIDRLHFLIDFPAPDVVRFVEVLVLSNLGDRTIQGGIEIQLPQGASNFEFQDGVLGGRYALSQTGILDLAPLVPGSASGQMVFSFTLPYDGSLDFAQPIDYPVMAVIALTESGGPVVISDLLQDTGENQTPMGSFRSYQGGGLMPGSIFSMRLRGKSAVGSASTEEDSMLVLAIGAGVLGFALVVGGLWWFRSLRRGDQPLAEDVDRFSFEDDQDQEVILQDLADLDDAYQAGAIPEDEYQSRRTQLKSVLLNRMQGHDD